MSAERKSEGLLHRAEELKNESIRKSSQTKKSDGLLQRAEILARKTEIKTEYSMNPNNTNKESQKIPELTPFEMFSKPAEKQSVEKKLKGTVEQNPDVKKTAEKETVPKSEKKKKPRRQRRHMNKILFRLIFVLAVLACFAAGIFYGYKKITTINIERSHALVEKQLSLCQEFVTAKYRYSDIIVVKKSLGFSKSYSIVKYSGLLRAGIADVTDIEYKVSNNGKSVTIKVPKAELLGNELVSQDVFDEKQSIFVPISTQEIFDEIEDARREVADTMLAEGFLDEARMYAIKIISQFMYSAGFDEVIVR